MFLIECKDDEDARATPRLRILHVTEAPLGGVAAYMREMINGQVRSGSIAELHVLIPDVNEKTIETLASDKLKISTFAHRGRSLLTVVRLTSALIRVVMRLRPDIIHAHATIAGVVVRLCVLFLPVKSRVVYCPHGWLFNKYGLKWYLREAIVLIERALARAADLIVCVSEYERKCAIRVALPDTKCVVVRSGIADLPGYRAHQPAAHCTASRLRALYVGRFDRDKGFDIFLEAMRDLKGHVDGIAVGANITEKPFEQPIPDNVVVYGWRDRDKLDSLYGQSDLAIVPSRAEAFGLAALEAMRAGLPVFCTRVGGLPELVAEGVTGCMFDADDTNQLTSLIRSTERSMLQLYGSRGRQRYLQRFSAETMNRSMLEHYSKLIEAKAVGR